MTARDTWERAIGPWIGPHGPFAMQDNARLNALTPSGLHFGEGPFAALANDPLAKPIIDARTALMQQMIAMAQWRRSDKTSGGPS